MENQTDEIESEKIADMFLCCVCLDLLYKPIVLACGHASCFWCVHKSMNLIHESHCPMCRHPYSHFPTICQFLHTLILKMYPLTYKRREKQILEEEKKIGHSSPNMEVFCASQEAKLPADLNNTGTRVQHGICGAYSTVIELQKSCKDTSYQISIDDMSCPTCKQLLFRPVVLNCGHVYCESCIDPIGGSLKCQICGSPHPRGFPKVYLELDHFLEERFTNDYEARKITKKAHIQHENEFQSSGSGSTKDVKNGLQIPATSDEEFSQWCVNNSAKLHFGIGCDNCGMFPIIGERYKCKDCKEAVGFDLCENCYNTQSKLPGRFNQQHTPDHSFVTLKSNGPYNMILQLLRNQPDFTLQFLASENEENNVPNLNELVLETVDNAENSLVPAQETMDNVEIVVTSSSTSGTTEDAENAENSILVTEESTGNVEIVVINSSTSNITEDVENA